MADEVDLEVAAAVVAMETSLAETEEIEETSVVVDVAMEIEGTEETSVVAVDAVAETSEVYFVEVAVIVVAVGPKEMVLLLQSTTRVPFPASAESKCFPKTHPLVLKRAQIDIHNYFYFDMERHSVAGQVTKLDIMQKV